MSSDTQSAPTVWSYSGNRRPPGPMPGLETVVPAVDLDEHVGCFVSRGLFSGRDARW